MTFAIYILPFFVTNPNSIPVTFAIYILPFKHCYNILVLLFQQSINLYTQMKFQAPHNLSVPFGSL